ncbi:hypothetical protein HY029_05090 [Candidatus Gottesmanbacteria bacterium]|nr:hypothetical protein [Candidatus Gottesmanbacteria bacterium]
MKVFAVDILNYPPQDESYCYDHIRALQAIGFSIFITVFLLIGYYIITTFLIKKFKKSYLGYIFIIIFGLFIYLIERYSKYELIPNILTLYGRCN